MAKWLHRLEVAKEFRAAKDGKMSVDELADAVAKKLSALKISQKDLAEDRDELVERFQSLSDATADEFDDIWDDLYDWADTDTLYGSWPKEKLCWVNIHG